MGRGTEGFYFINQKTVDTDDKILYCSLTITDEVKQIRKDHQKFKKTGLIPNKDGTNRLF